MAISGSDKQADFLTDLDNGGNPSLMEPLILSSNSPYRGPLTDLAIELATKSAGLSKSLPAGITNALANLVRAMNCYYSNLIEGHNTHPIDIERALKEEYSHDKHKRNLQLEAKAHISVQYWIDQGGLKDQRAVTLAGILEVHKRFCELLPKELLVAKGPKGKKESVVPGELRQHSVQVGKHIAISPGALPRFFQRFETVYSRLGKAEIILGCAAVHHRLLWIHPFLDGNGRVARLVSYAQLLETLNTCGLWSVSRGLARSESVYKQHLIACDQRRKNDTDGRGSLSESALAEFTRFFLETCIDQVNFMENLIEPAKLHKRIIFWIQEEIKANRLLPHAGTIIETVLYRGELLRSEVPRVTGLGDRQGRRVIANLIDRGVLTAQTDRAPLHLAFPAALAPYWMPGLFPDKPID